MKKIISMFALLLFLSGCAQSTKRYDTAMKNGLEAINSHQYDLALSEFDKAISEKSEDSLAKANRMQTYDLIEAKKFMDESKLSEANDSLDKVINERLGSPQIAEHARKEKEKIGTRTPKSNEEDFQNNHQEKNNWNKLKANELDEFMESWGASMDQTYQSYSPEKNVDFYGVLLPSSTLNGDWNFSVNQKSVPIKWSEEGNGENDLVAVYSDADTQPYLEKHLYYFVIQSGQPKVYITQQNQGNEMNYLNFSETKNEALKQGFSKIVLFTE